ncbi:MAG: hypothetical protein JWM57_459 [Phycisphaerales bacterium]|nr:hypothetical protein [Phycisphaerales bacterium]
MLQNSFNQTLPAATIPTGGAAVPTMTPPSSPPSKNSAIISGVAFERPTQMSLLDHADRMFVKQISVRLQEDYLIGGDRRQRETGSVRPAAESVSHRPSSPPPSRHRSTSFTSGPHFRCGQVCVTTHSKGFTSNAPSWIRTSDLPLRRRLLYPTELWAPDAVRIGRRPAFGKTKADGQ